MKGGSPHTPLRRPQNGTQAHAPGRDRRVASSRPVAALPRFGTAVEPPSGDRIKD